PGFKAADSCLDGKYVRLPLRTEKAMENFEMPRWGWKDLEEHMPSATSSIFILCRNNAPLMKMAFRLIRRRISVEMLGRSIGKNLTALSKKLMPEDGLEKSKCVSAIKEWEEIETEAALLADRQGKVEEVSDRAECL